MTQPAPALDLVVFGATSFVGQILTRYLSEYLPGSGETLRWALAGRSETKLRELRDSLGAAGQALPIIVADAADEAQLRALCAQTRVVVSTVGPYALYGEPLVRTCAQTGTDYCDLTGETQWIKRMIERYEPAARQSGARIVHCCGFDSVPSDLGVLFLQQHARRQWGVPATQVKMRVRTLKGGASGGTVASVINVVREAAADPALRRELLDPYALCPKDHRFTVRQHAVRSAEFDRDGGTWIAPFVMAAINERVVHRSNALAGYAYGSRFTYDEAVITGTGLKGRLAALTMVAGLGAFMAGVLIKPVRGLMERFLLPKPGEGPSVAAQQAGRYDLRFFGRADDGRTLRVKVTGDRDPGYGSTGKMLGQAAVGLALDRAPAAAKRPGAPAASGRPRRCSTSASSSASCVMPGCVSNCFERVATGSGKYRTSRCGAARTARRRSVGRGLSRVRRAACRVTGARRPARPSPSPIADSVRSRGGRRRRRST